MPATSSRRRLNQVSGAAIAARAGTTAAPEVMTNDPVRAERSDNIDIGLTVKPVDGLTFGFGGFYKLPRTPRQGPVRRADLPDRLQLLERRGAGLRTLRQLRQGPVVALRQPRLVAGQLGININSAQFNFEQAELAFIASNWIFPDHNQSWTGSAGAAYTFNMGSDWATRVSADMLYGNGLRTDAS